jgi:hypothetical protein
MKKKYEESGKSKKYYDLQNHYRYTMMMEWFVIHGSIAEMKNNDTLYIVLDRYVINRNSAKEVYEFLSNNIYQHFDITKTSLEADRLRERELREFRIDIYYNLTPKEKIEVDIHDFGSDEWNSIIDGRVDVYLDPYEILDLEENTEKKDIHPEVNDEGWNDDF